MRYNITAFAKSLERNLSFYPLRTMLVVLCLAAWQAQAQLPTFTSLRSTGGTRPNSGNAVAVNAAGETYVAGSFGFEGLGGSLDLTTTNLVSAGDSDGYVAKFNAQGQCLWARQMAGLEANDAYDVIVRSDGSILVTGEFVGTNQIGNTTLISHGGYDIFLAAFSTAGDLLWARAIGGDGDDFAIALAPAAGGSALFTGSFIGNIELDGMVLSSVDDDALLIKLTPSGGVQWAQSGGGPGFQLGSDVKVDSAGNVYWAGEFETNIVFGTASLTSEWLNVFLAKYDAAGNRLSLRKLGEGEGAELPRIALGPNGTLFCAAGYFGEYSIAGQQLPVGVDDILLASFDSNENLRWATAFGGAELDTCTEVVADAYGACYLAGHFRGAMNVGNTNLVSTGSLDVFVVRCNPQGQLQGAVKAGGLGQDQAFSAAMMSSGDIRLTGSFAGTAQFGSFSATSPDGLPKMFLATMAPAPTLRIEAFPTHTVVSWPGRYTGFTLQQSSTLAPSSWGTVPTAPVLRDGEFVVTNQLSGGPKFFRLRN